jgi:hypothetical protein
MEKKQNEFKISINRGFGSEQLALTSTIYSDNIALSEEEIIAQTQQFASAIEKGYRAVQERTISELDISAEYALKRAESVRKQTEALKKEVEEKVEAQKVLKEAEKISNKQK